VRRPADTLGRPAMDAAAPCLAVPAGRQQGRTRTGTAWGIALAAVIAVAAGWQQRDQGTEAPTRASDVRATSVATAALPEEAGETLRLIRAGGPFRYEKDGSTFGNRERLLPTRDRGYYREYTVTTPGSDDRGARRIVCGGWQPRTPDACYYTADHYRSFHPLSQ